jgi:hypothetical protein
VRRRAEPLPAAPRWTVADVSYDAATHTSRLPDGTDVPHVTAVLRAVGVSTDFEALAETGPRMGAAIRHAGARGSAVHADCHAYDDDDLDLADSDPRVRPYVEAWAECREAKGLLPITRERRLYHPLYGYTGIMDGLFTAPNGRVVLGDLKTGDPESSACAYQTAAYEGACRAMDPGTRIDERWAIWLQPGLRVPYRITNYTAHRQAYADFPSFLSFLTTFRAQAVRRIARS